MDAPVIIESSEQPLDLVPKLAGFAVAVPFDFPVRLRRHDRRHPSSPAARRVCSPRLVLKRRLNLGVVGPDRAETIRHRRIAARSRALGSPGTAEAHTRIADLSAHYSKKKLHGLVRDHAEPAMNFTRMTPSPTRTPEYAHQPSTTWSPDTSASWRVPTESKVSGPVSRWRIAERSITCRKSISTAAFRSSQRRWLESV